MLRKVTIPILLKADTTRSLRVFSISFGRRERKSVIRVAMMSMIARPDMTRTARKWSIATALRDSCQPAGGCVFVPHDILLPLTQPMHELPARRNLSLSSKDEHFVICSRPRRSFFPCPLIITQKMPLIVMTPRAAIS
jgi:hypothetical protein